MHIEGEALAELIKDGAPIHILQQELDIDYYGRIEIAPEEEGRPLTSLTIRLDISPEKFATAPTTGTMLECNLTGSGCVYRFQTSYRASSTLPDTIWYINLPESAERIQLRDFVRVPIPMTIQIKFPGSHGSMKNYTEVPMLDISGNGVGFIYPEPVNIGIPLYVKIDDLPRIGTLESKMTVMRSTPIENNLGIVYHIGATLGDQLTSREQERLVQSIYQLQHIYLKRGLKIPNMNHNAAH